MSVTKTSIATKGILLVAVPLAFELGFGVTMLGLQSYYHKVIENESRAKAIIFHANELWLWSTDAVTSRIEGKVFSDAKNTFGDEQQHIESEFKILEGLLNGDKVQMERLQTIKRVIATIIAIGDQFEDTSASADLSDFKSKIAVLRGRFTSFQSLQSQIKRLSLEIRAFRAPEELKSQSSAKEVAMLQAAIDRVIIASMVLSAVLSGALLVYFRRSIQSGIKVLLGNTQRLSESRPLLPELSSGDELSTLDHSFHDMARALEAATRRERATLNNAADTICVLNRELRIIYANPAATQLLGFSADEIKEKGIRYFVLEPDWNKLEETMKDIAAVLSNQKFELQMVDAAEKIIWTSWSVQWSPDDGEYFCVVHDISEAKELEQLKREFFAMVSHDMRTPLTSLVCAVNILRETGGVKPEANDYLNLAEQNSRYLFTLIQDLLDVERLAAGAFPLSKEIVSANEVTEQACSVVAPLAQKAGVSLDIARTELELHADREAILRILVNLISNAVKFSPKGTNIEVSSVSAPNQIEFRVSDRGAGIPEELQTQIFDRFKQVSLDDSRKRGGLGLGLSICKGLTEAHGGAIGVRSRSGGGTTFWFTIPYDRGSKT